MNLLEPLLGKASPYIANLVYDVDVRLLFIEVVDNPDSQKPVQRIVFPEVIHYAETSELDKPDDETVDDIVDIYRRHDGCYCIDTYKKSIVLKTAAEPFTEAIRG